MWRYYPLSKEEKSSNDFKVWQVQWDKDTNICCIKYVILVYYLCFIFSLQKMPLKQVDTFMSQHLLRASVVRLLILLLALSFMNYHNNKIYLYNISFYFKATEKSRLLQFCFRINFILKELPSKHCTGQRPSISTLLKTPISVSCQIFQAMHLPLHFDEAKDSAQHFLGI